jgi:hypothetical protein
MRGIPKVIHYTFGMNSDFGGKPWSLVHFVCLKSAVERIKPDKVNFYCEYEPAGPWWDVSRGLVDVIRIAAPREIFGRPLLHVAHRSDVVRLQMLIAHGGIYLDSDVLVQRSFDGLLDHSCVLGREGEETEFGMANAVILAEPNSPFLRRWLDEYRWFRSTGRDEFWNEHSVKLPAQLAAQHPDDITVLHSRAFFWPLWTDEHLDWIFRSTRPIPLDDTYANHLWEANAWQFLEGLTPGRVRAEDSNFHCWARPFVRDLADGYGALPLRRRLRKRLGRALKPFRRIKSRADEVVGHAVRLIEAKVLGDDARRRRTFQDIYRNNLWGQDGQSRFYSGVGSRGAPAEAYVAQMAALLQAHAAQLGRPIAVIDLGCGDFHVGRELLARVPLMTYVGCDIVPELIAQHSKNHTSDRVSFRVLDIVSDPLPDGDVCLVRQVLQHLSNAEVAGAIQRLDHRWVYVTEGHPRTRSGAVNPDKPTGADVRFDWRVGEGRGVELNQPPYNLQTEEMFRVPAPPGEIIVTERIVRPVDTRPARVGSMVSEAD